MRIKFFLRQGVAGVVCFVLLCFCLLSTKLLEGRGYMSLPICPFSGVRILMCQLSWK